MGTSIHDLRGMVRASKRRARRAASGYDVGAYRKARSEQHAREYALKNALGESKARQRLMHDGRHGGPHG